MDQLGYAANLDELDAVTRAQLLQGDWQVRPEGVLFKREWLTVVEQGPAKAARVRYWDKAATEGGGARSAGVLIARSPEKLYYVEDVVCGHWSALKREQIMRATAARDGEEVRIWLEQEPGSGGKESAEASIRNLAGYVVHADRVTGDKVSRAQPLAAQCEAGNVRIVRAAWNQDYLEELCSFPLGVLKDQVDASTGAFNKLSRGAAADWTPEEIARVGRRWAGLEAASSSETYLEYHRRLRQTREVQQFGTGEPDQAARTHEELAAEKRRAYEAEVEETNRLALMRVRGGR